jgi:hypothetical protein
MNSGLREVARKGLRDALDPKTLRCVPWFKGLSCTILVVLSHHAHRLSLREFGVQPITTVQSNEAGIAREQSLERARCAGYYRPLVLCHSFVTDEVSSLGVQHRMRATRHHNPAPHMEWQQQYR